MNPMQFNTDTASHEHALETLEMLYEYDDFMLSIDTLLDVGCGTGKDLEWWATRTTRDEENPEPLNIKCVGIDLANELKIDSQYENIEYRKRDFEQMDNPDQFDVVWCHDTFQYAINPLETLKHFYRMMSTDGMLAIVIPQSTNVVYHKQEFNQLDGVFYNHTLVSLIHMLAVSGFDCKNGFFKKEAGDPWLHAVVYKSEHKPMDPRTTRWYDLMDLGLLPSSAENGISRAGHLRQQDLVLPWLNKSNINYGQQ